MKTRLLTLLLLIVTLSMARAQIIVSDFSTDADGWTANGTGGILYNTAGKYVTSTDYNVVTGPAPIYVYWNFIAPPKFTGNKSLYYNGTLSFDLQQTVARTLTQPTADIQISSGTTTIYYFSLSPGYPATAPGWTTYQIPLNEISGKWKTSNSSTGTAAAPSDIQFALTNCISLSIRGRYAQAPLSTGSLDNVMLTPFVVTTQPTPQTVCSGTTATLTTAATGNSAITYQWQMQIATGGFANIADGALYSGSQTATLNIQTTATAGAGTYHCLISGTGADNFATNAVLVKVNTTPGNPGASGANACPPATLNLVATGGGTGLYRWYASPTGGTAFTTGTNGTFTTPPLTVTTDYYVSINNGTCEGGRTLSIATVLPVPSAPGTTGAVSCSGSASLTLMASGGANGNYRWYTVATGGIAIAGQVNSTYATPVITSTTTYYASITNGSCESTRTAVVAQIASAPGGPLTTNASACASSAVQISVSASGGTAGNYRWYTQMTGGTPISGETNSTYLTPLITSTTNYYVSINNGTCEGPRTPVTAIVNIPPAPPTTTDNGGCGPSTVPLSASGAADGQYVWYTSLTGGAISGEVHPTYTTPLISATTTYYVSINNGTCESTRAAVIAVINSVPGLPSANGVSGCIGSTFPLTASGAADGNYRWYTFSSGGVAITGAVNSIFTTGPVAATTTWYVSVNVGGCEGSRTAVTVTITGTCDSPPVITATTGETHMDGVYTVSLTSLVSDPDNNADLSTLKIVAGPTSGAQATIDASHNLIVSYKGLAFVGKDSITIQVCDVAGLCAQQVIVIDVDEAGDIQIYNGMSPNDDGQNDGFVIENITAKPETSQNHVTIFDRWGDKVFDTDNYDNVHNPFMGIGKNGSLLPIGIYFYKIDFTSGVKSLTGYLALKR